MKEEIIDILERNIEINFEPDYFSGNDKPYIDGYENASIDIEEYVKEKSVNFLNWTLTAECKYSCTDENQWNSPDYNENRKTITTEELFEEFLKK